MSLVGMVFQLLITSTIDFHLKTFAPDSSHAYRNATGVSGDSVDDDCIRVIRNVRHIVHNPVTGDTSDI